MIRMTFRILLAGLIVLISRIEMLAESPAPWRLKPALLVVDVQNEFLPMMAPEGQKTALKNMDMVIRWFHGNDFPVVRVYQGGKHGPAAGTPAFEFPDSLSSKADDLKVVKEHGNAFKSTGLEKLLRGKGVNTLFVCGLSATGCVLATWHGAVELDFKAYLVRDALMSPNAAHTAAVQDFVPSVSVHALALTINSMAR